ncbi:GIY-YIG nuclease family protein [Bradyrhizobium sp. BR 10261]|uniref:GIY-YIG nuclease family protein n=1 Tax=Bradyrhizobium sp. BR 10261 TaxID=2749992 RepID=UPI001C651FEE|nr:GIY-YIG nuclease family protein [Bradyrhizobium sp. BR 10261]MBW7965282.1 GIY-YIG nuclease family protein [Bradyrhizobium sp. BR 10261]
MTSRKRIPGCQRLPKPGGCFTWYWSASQISRLSSGFYPRSVRLWHGLGEPDAAELEQIEARARQLTLDLEDWLAQPERKVRSARGYVYVIKAGENVKIGFSKDVDQRQKQLQTFFPFPLELLLSMPGSALTERQLHRRFKCSRVTGEWFRLTPEISTFVQQNNVRTACQNRGPECQNRREKV